MTGRYLDDFRIGEKIETGGVTLTESAIMDFALQFDPQPFHIDAEAAKTGPFAGIIASGFHSISAVFRLFIDTDIFKGTGLGGPGIDELRWLKPVRPGDTLRAVVEIKEVKPSSTKPDRGLVRFALSAMNQRHDTVMTATLLVFVRRKTAENAA